MRKMMMEYQVGDPRARVTSSFSISDEKLDPEEATRVIGLKPLVVGWKGRRLRPDAKAKLQVSYWGIKFEKEASDDIDHGISRVLDIIWPRRKEIVSFLRATGFQAGFSTSVTVHEDQPLFCLRPQTLSKMAYFKVDYLWDFHDMREGT